MLIDCQNKLRSVHYIQILIFNFILLMLALDNNILLPQTYERFYDVQATRYYNNESEYNPTTTRIMWDLQI